MIVPRLIIVLGPPCSGKSTVATQLRSLLNGYVLSTDDLYTQFVQPNPFRDQTAASAARHNAFDLCNDAMFALADTMLAYRRAPLILCATFTRFSVRCKLLTFAYTHNLSGVHLITCRAPIEQIIRRFSDRQTAIANGVLSHPSAYRSVHDIREAAIAYPYDARSVFWSHDGREITWPIGATFTLDQLHTWLAQAPRAISA